MLQIPFYLQALFGAGGGTRTRTELSLQRILSPFRDPRTSARIGLIGLFSTTFHHPHSRNLPIRTVRDRSIQQSTCKASSAGFPGLQGIINPLQLEKAFIYLANFLPLLELCRTEQAKRGLT